MLLLSYVTVFLLRFSSATPSQYPPLQDPLASPVHSSNVSGCPGYVLGSLKQRSTGLTAQLSLAGPACNAFGRDISKLTVQVTYESETRLHVNIFDTDDKQYTIPHSVIERPAPPTNSFEQSSDLVFNYDSSPFAFWITRRSQPKAAPLFDTRISSFPKAPIGPVVVSDTSITLDGFPDRKSVV